MNPSRLAQWLRRTFRVLGIALVGHDVFVSYARDDAREYARTLAQGLEEANLWTFVDYQAIPPGEQLRKALDWGLRRSRLLVVVCSAKAVASKWVALEVERFPKTRRSLVPINIEGQFQKAPWKLDALELVWVDESIAALESGRPTPGVIESVLKQVSHRRRRLAAMQIAGAVLFTLGVVAATALAYWLQLQSQRESTLAQRLVALAQGDFQTHPANLETPTLVLLESARRRATPEAADALFGILRLMRQAIGSLQLGRAVQNVSLSPDGSLILATGYSSTPNRSFVAVVDADTMALRWQKEFAGFVRAARWTTQGMEIVVATAVDGLLVLAGGSGAQRHQVTSNRNVIALAVSGNGRWMATGTDAGVVALWDARQWTVAATATAGRNVLALQFSPIGERLAAGGGMDFNGGGAVFLWRTDAGLELQAQVAVPHDVSNLAFSPNGQLVGAGGSTRASIVDVANASIRASLSHGGSINAVAFDPGGTYVATAATDRTARVFRLSDGVEAGLYAHRDNVTAVAFDPDGQSLLTASWDGTLRTWGLPPHSGTAETFNADREEARMGHGGWVTGFATDARRSRVISSSQDGFVRSWSLKSDPRFRFSRSEVTTDLEPSPDGSVVASAGMLYEPGLWPLSGDGKVVRLTRHENDLFDASFNDDGQLLAVSDSDSAIHVYAGPQFKMISRIQVSAPRIAFAGGVLAAIGGSRLTLWNPADGALLQDLKWPAPLRALGGGGRHLAVGDTDGTVAMFDVSTRQAVERKRWKEVGPIRSLVFDGTHGVLGVADGGGAVGLWKTNNLEAVRTFKTGDEVVSLAFDRAGDFLAVGSEAGTVTVWSAAGDPVARFTHGTGVRSVAFSMAGPPLLFFGGLGGFAFTPWQLPDLVTRACAALSRKNLSAVEWDRFVGDGVAVSSCDRFATTP